MLHLTGTAFRFRTAGRWRRRPRQASFGVRPPA